MKDLVEDFVVSFYAMAYSLALLGLAAFLVIHTVGEPSGEQAPAQQISAPVSTGTPAVTPPPAAKPKAARPGVIGL